MSLENTDSIIKGAEIIAANMNAGLSRDEADAKVVSDLRLAQRQKYRERNAREGNRAAALEFLAQDDKAFQSSSAPVDIDDVFDFEQRHLCIAPALCLLAQLPVRLVRHSVLQLVKFCLHLVHSLCAGPTVVRWRRVSGRAGAHLLIACYVFLIDLQPLIFRVS